MLTYVWKNIWYLRNTKSLSPSVWWLKSCRWSHVLPSAPVKSTTVNRFLCFSCVVNLSFSVKFVCLMSTNASAMSCCVGNYQLNCCSLRRCVTLACLPPAPPSCPEGSQTWIHSQRPRHWTGGHAAQRRRRRHVCPKGLQSEMRCRGSVWTDWHSEITDVMLNAPTSVSFHVFYQCFEGEWQQLCRCLKEPLTSRRGAWVQVWCLCATAWTTKAFFCVRVTLS